MTDEESEEIWNRYPCAFIPELTYGEYDRFKEKDNDALQDLVWRHTLMRISDKRLPKHRFNKKGRDLP